MAEATKQNLQTRAASVAVTAAIRASQRLRETLEQLNQDCDQDRRDTVSDAFRRALPARR